MTPEEVRKMLQERDERKKEKLIATRDKILSEIQAAETATAPLINSEDADFLATTQVKLT